MYNNINVQGCVEIFPQVVIMVAAMVTNGIRSFYSKSKLVCSTTESLKTNYRTNSRPHTVCEDTQVDSHRQSLIDNAYDKGRQTLFQPRTMCELMYLLQS